MKDKIEFREFKVIIIESLSEKEQQTGTALYNDLLKFKMLQESDFKSEVVKAKNKQDFLDTLELIEMEIRDDKVYPVLHFEIHGNEKGLILNNGDLVDWSEIFNKLLEINTLLKNSLVLNLAVCKGASILSIINPDERAPFRSMIGSGGILYSKEIYNGFLEFYDILFFKFDLKEALDKLNKRVIKGSSKYHIISCETCFDYITTLHKETEHFKKLVAELREEDLKNNPELKVLPTAELDKIVETKLEIIMSDAKKNRNYFLMNDIK